MSLQRYFLGCPIWSLKTWVGTLFTHDARQADFLRQYSAVFNTVEGNTTFYGLPNPATVERWEAEAAPGFRFAFKFPRTISHDRRLRDVEAPTAEFFERLSPLGEKQGPFFLQLPASFGPKDLSRLAGYLETLPPELDYAVEVRHPELYAGGPAEAELDALLVERGIDRVIFDTRALRTADPSDSFVREAQERKPDLPVRAVVTGARPFLRFVSHPELEANLPFLQGWADTVAGWIEAGQTPYVFMHSPDDFYAPQVARAFHTLLRERLDVGALPRWPGEADATPTQLTLL